MNRFIDTETCGFHGPALLIQYADDDGSIHLHEIWRNPIIDTVKLIEETVTKTVVGFNLTYDWFHLCKTYTTLIELMERVGPDEHPVDHINEYAKCELPARDGPCLKPYGALDLLLYARKGPYQSTMDRRDIRIKRVPRTLAPFLIKELEGRVPLKSLYFARRKDGQRWHITEIKDCPDFVDVVLKFAASAALKALANDVLGAEVTQFKDIMVNRKFNPVEVGWAPFALALSNENKDWKVTLKVKSQKKVGYAWPGVIQHHIDHWAYNPLARQYGADDIVYTRGLYNHWKPEPNDDDSILACMVGAVRWRGFTVDKEKIEALKAEAEITAKAAPTYSGHVYKYLTQVMSPDEVLTMEGSTKKVVIERISKFEEADCPKCGGDGCKDCVDGAIPHPAAARAKAVLAARQAGSKLRLFNKLLIAGRFHASLKVIGTLSSRMSGADGLNATGVEHEKVIRSCFTLSHPEDVLCGGDFSSYEVSIADARYNDPDLRKQLLTCWVCKEARTIPQFEETYCPHCGAGQSKCKKCKKGLVVDKDQKVMVPCGCLEPTPNGDVEDTLRKIHGLFGMELCPTIPGTDEPSTYEYILSTKGLRPDYYDQGKRGVFAKFYGGNYHTLMTRIGIDEETAKQADEGFDNRYQGVGAARREIFDKFCSMKQPEGIGSKIYWSEPDEAVYSLNGHPRFFTLENQITKALFHLAENPPESWMKLRVQVVRRDREQKIGGAVRSAVFAAAFAIQSQVARAAANHEIQATGAKETKRLQVAIWTLQPRGIHSWAVQPFQVHDEIWAPCKPALVDAVSKIVREFVIGLKSLIPLVKIDWATHVKNWSEK